MSEITNKEFTRLLTRTAKCAAKHQSLLNEVAEECERRYGIVYSDVDADTIIDKLDLCGADSMTAEEFDIEMREALSIAGVNP